MNGLGVTIKMNLVTSRFIHLLGSVDESVWSSGPGLHYESPQINEELQSLLSICFHGAWESPAQAVWACHVLQSCSRTLLGYSI